MYPASTGYSFNPRIAVDSTGGINVVWVDTTPGNQDVFFSRSTDGGAGFSAPQKSFEMTRRTPQARRWEWIRAENISVVCGKTTTLHTAIMYRHSTERA